MVMKKLNVQERLMAMNILPREGGMLTLRLIRELTAKLGLNADELKEFEVKQEGQTITWNEKGKEEKPISFKDKELLRIGVRDLLGKDTVQADKCLIANSIIHIYGAPGI